ncbi:MAG: HAMP domain-containing protein, partial [Chloroflexota bacterium]
MFNWFNNLRLGPKLLIAFLGLTIIVGGVLGGVSMLSLNNVNQIILEITDQRLPSVKNSTAVERYALRTILDEKKYLYAYFNENVDGLMFQKSAMTNIDQINKSLDQVDKVANQYNDQDLLAKSKEVRTVTAQYKDLFNQGVTQTQNNKTLATTMADNGTKVSDLAKAFFNSKTGKSDEQSLKQIPILVDIWDTALETRLNQNKYMRTMNQQYLTDMNNGLKKLGVRYDDLRKVTTDPADLQKIDGAMAATDVFNKAAQDWVTNDNELKNKVLTQMDSIGTKVQETAMAAEDAGWAAADATKVKSSGIVSQAILMLVIVLVIAILIGLMLGLFISRSIANAAKLLVKTAEQISQMDLPSFAEATTAIANGDLTKSVSVQTQSVAYDSKDEMGDLARAFNAMITKLQDVGTNFTRMTTNLQELIGEVSESALTVGSTSNQLATAADQTGN